MKNLIQLFAALMLGIFSTAQAQDLEALVAECEACHGSGGHSDQADIPSLAGRDTDELLQNLEQFYYYERHCPTTKKRHGEAAGETVNMCNLVNTLSQEERLSLAEYFQSQAQ